MPPSLSSDPLTIVAAAAGVVAGTAVFAWGILHWDRRQQRHEGPDSPDSSWTAQQVAAWLRENGVSKSSVMLCCRYRVDGDTLMRLTAQDLYYMSVPLRDARIILAAIEDVRNCPVILSSVLPRSVSRRRSSPSLRSAQLPVPSSAEQFEAAWRALVRTCTLPANNASPAEQQQRLAVYTGTLLESFQVLTVSEQAAALSLVAAAEKVRVFPSGNMSREVHPAPLSTDTPADTSFSMEAMEEKLKPLHGMLDGFLDFLRSPDLDAVAPAEFEELGERVAAQVKRVLRVAEQLPPELKSLLRRKCDDVFEALSNRQRTMPGASGSKAPDRATLMQALRNVLSVVEDPALRALPTAQRMQVLSSLAKKAEAIEAIVAGSVSHAPKDAEVLSTVQSLLRIIQEETRASQREAEADAQPAADEEGEEEKVPAAEDADATGGSISVIVATVQDVQATLQSEAFQCAPAAAKVELCTSLLQRVTALEDNLAALPPPAQAMVRDLLLNTKKVLAVMMATAESEGGHGAEDLPAEDEADEEEQDSDGDAEAAQAEREKSERANSSTGIETSVAQLERIFDFLTSDSLGKATVRERQQVASKLLQRVEAIKLDVAAHDTQGTLIRELIGPLEELLFDMAGNHSASPEFLEITAPLRDVQLLLTSDSYRQLPRSEKLRIAGTVLPQLHQLTSSFSSLSDSERVAAEALVQPINEELLRLSRRCDLATGSAQEVLNRLQAVMRSIQGAEFTTMLPAERSSWATNTVAELDQLRDCCVTLGAKGEEVLPLIERLRNQLSGLLPDRSDAEGGEGHGDSCDGEHVSDGDNGEAQQKQEGKPADLVWGAVRDSHAELLAAERTATSLPPERLKRMLRVMSEAAELQGMSAQQEAALQEFGNLLRRHVEAMTGQTNGGGGGAKVADAESDCDEGNAALHALRRSLQMLINEVHGENKATTAELSVVARKTEELISGADAANINWRGDSQCARAMRSILEALQQLRGSEDGASGARVPSKVESVLQSSLEGLIVNPPTSMEDFAPYIRVLELTQSSAEQLTNRELMQLKRLQEAVIKAMQQLPELPPPNREKNGLKADDEAEEGCNDEEVDRVEAVFDTLRQMSYKLREGPFSAEELDEFEKVQEDLARFLADEGVDVGDSIKAVREQIRLQREALTNGEAGDEEELELAGNEEDDIDVLQSELQCAEQQTLGSLPAEGTDAFNEDDDDGVCSNGAAVISGLSPGYVQHATGGERV
ncbi:hypothetical protein, conserved [Leishmania lindenbergi]|uniref:SAM domain-containing protein n=1 Tax=Leishmania lindenbergi TaxID=651832 RepID=A0AAW3A6G0_9TRYP